MTGYVPTNTYNEGQSAQDARIATLEKNSVPLPTSISYSDVDIATAWAKGNEREGNYASVILPFPCKTFHDIPESATVSGVTVRFAEVLYLDGSPWYHIDHNIVVLTADFVGAGVRLAASVPKSSLPSDIETKSYILHFIVHVTIS